MRHDSMKRIRNFTTTPPGMWWYKLETGIRIPPTNFGNPGYYSFNDLEDAVVKHYKANGGAPPSNLRDRILDQMCSHVPPEMCEENGRPLALGMFGSLRQTLSLIADGTALMLDWLSRGFEFVPQGEADERSRVCAGCPYNGPVVGCTSCAGSAIKVIRDRMGKLVGSRKTVMDEKLAACYICGCELKLKVWAPLDMLREHAGEVGLRQFPGKGAWEDFPGCWMLKNPSSKTP